MVLQDRFKDSPYKYPSPEKEEPRRNTVAKIAQRSSNPAVFSCDHESLADHVGGLAMEYFFLISVDSDSNTGLFTLWSVLRNDVLHVTWMFHLKTLPNAQTASLNDVSPCWSACPVKVTCSGWKHLSMAPDVPVQPPPRSGRLVPLLSVPISLGNGVGQARQSALIGSIAKDPRVSIVTTMGLRQAVPNEGLGTCKMP